MALASGATLVRAASPTRFLTECNGIGPLWFASPRHSSELLIMAWLWHCLETWRSAKEPHGRVKQWQSREYPRSAKEQLRIEAICFATALPREAGRGKGMAGKGDEQPRRGAAMRYPATAEKGEKTHGDALICSGKAEYRRAGSSKGKEKQLQCEEIHLCLFCLLI